MPAEEAARYAKGLIDRTIMAFLPSDLTFLRAGGRLSNARYIGAQILKVKPCVEAIDGKLVAYRRRLSPLVVRIPTAVTCLCIVLMLANVLLTMGAFDSWYRRMDGISAPTPIQSFFATHFDDDFMEGRFQNMSLFPNDTIRPQKEWSIFQVAAFV